MRFPLVVLASPADELPFLAARVPPPAVVLGSPGIFRGGMPDDHGVQWSVEGWSNSDALAEMEHFGAHSVLHDLRRFVATFRPGS